jgi:hypothetical protein
MATAPYSGKVFELGKKDDTFEDKKRLTFVDVFNEDGSRPGPPMIINKKGKDESKYKHYVLTDSGAFILSFVLHRVDTDLIKQIYMSEYGTNESTTNAEIKALIDDLEQRKLIHEVTRITKPHETPQVTRERKWTDDYPDGLEPKFKVGRNQMGGIRVKYPT